MTPEIKAALEVIARAARAFVEGVRELMRSIGEHLERLRIALARYAEREDLIVRARAVGMAEAQVRPLVEWVYSARAEIP